MTEIILKQAVENLGEAGDVVDVKPGYARNYLLPQEMAMPATEGNLKRLEEERRHLERAVEREREVAETAAGKLRDLSLTFNERAGEGGRLYGSVSAQDVVGRLSEKGVDVEPRAIQLEEPIKELGVYPVTVDLHPDVKPEIKIWVVAEE